jgi:hypothetical protein
MDGIREIEVSEDNVLAVEMHCEDCEVTGVIPEYEGNHVCSQCVGSGEIACR